MNKAVLIAALCGSVSSAAAAQEKPNILFCLADDASFPYLGAYGCDWVRTPVMDSLAANGTLFTNAYTPNAKSGPSRSCILTGLYSWQLDAACNHFAVWPEDHKTFVEVLGENGYSVAMTGKGWAPGDPGEKNGRKRELTGTPYNAKKLTPATPYISNIDYAANFSAFIDGRDETKPFFFWYGAMEPHRFYEYGSGVSKGGYLLESIDEVPPYWPDCEQTRNDMLDYAFELKHFDAHLGMMVRKLEEEGLLDNTIIVVTADNGMPFPRVKGQAYHASNHVPMLIHWPSGIRGKGVRNTDFVNFIDLAPTFLDIAGIDGEACGMHRMEGSSLLPMIKSGKKRFDIRKDHVLIGKERHDIGRPDDQGYPIRGMVTSRYLYLYNYEPDRWPAGNPETGYLNCDGGAVKTRIIQDGRSGEGFFWRLNLGKRPQEELYDLKKDPHCMVNLASSSKGRHIARKLKDWMFRELSSQGDHRVNGDPEYYEKMAYSEGRHRNYYNRILQGEELPFPGWIIPSDVDIRAACSSDAGKPIVWIYTDMSDRTIPGPNKEGTLNDPDDISAMAGYLLLADCFDTRGIVVASTHRAGHKTSPDQGAWAQKFFGGAYAEDVKRLKAVYPGYPDTISFMQSCIKETGERYDYSKDYSAELDRYGSVKRLYDLLLTEEGVVNVLCWGSLTEPAILVNACLNSGNASLLEHVRFIAHWTDSPWHQGSFEHPENVANCREDSAACSYMKDMARKGMISYYECGAIGQHGIVSGSPRGQEYFGQFKRSRLGTIFAEGKFAQDTVDDSDCATYYVLLGVFGVSLDDLAPDGTNDPQQEVANEEVFRKNANRIRAELLKRSNIACGFGDVQMK